MTEYLILGEHFKIYNINLYKFILLIMSVEKWKNQLSVIKKVTYIV